MEKQITEEAMFVKIDINIKNDMDMYVALSKIKRKFDTNSQKKLIETAISDYIQRNQIP